MSKSVFITGASSGLGRQVASEFASRGYDLALAARQIDVLQTIKSELEERHGVRVLVYPLDVSDAKQVRDTLNTASAELGKLDIVVANAGLGSDGRIGRIDFANSRQLFEVNVIGACATIDAAITLFKSQGHGQIVAMSSIASWRGLPGSGAYSASKAAVSVYMEALRAESQGKNLTVTVIYPGYIDTPMNNKLKSRPFLLPLEEGGKRIADAILQRRKRAVIPGYPWLLLRPVLQLMPTALISKLF
ncbi:SDR family NAD(P)-dependent oxidoreductase [Pseudomonas sp.]|uniref:SDR family NAD(P)-dependent oxidoreductase n=1 Tax=Pseudomonas sp. TaxID=306 RepID=UPI002610B1BB|nr:SDR family NAD(P)-dependent oxidoreductase [Pseudomonas sp.]